jgi:DNA-binding NarL/FixJ family response regulator
VSIRVLLVDDEALVRSGIAMLLAGEADLEIVGECADGEEAANEALRLRPDVALIDVRLNGTDGIEVASLIRRRMGADAPAIVMLTSFDIDEAVWASLDAGVSGFVLKSRTHLDLVNSIQAVARGDVALEPRIVRLLVETYGRNRAVVAEPLEAGQLTPKEREVLLLVAEGLSNSELAARLVVEVGTIKTHIRHILEKLGLRDRSQAIAFVYKHGLKRPGG